MLVIEAGLSETMPQHSGVSAKAATSTTCFLLTLTPPTRKLFEHLELFSLAKAGLTVLEQLAATRPPTDVEVMWFKGWLDTLLLPEKLSYEDCEKYRYQ